MSMCRHSKVFEIIGPTGAGKTWLASRLSRSKQVAFQTNIVRDKWLLARRERSDPNNRRVETMLSIVPAQVRGELGKILFQEGNRLYNLSREESVFSNSFLNWCLETGSMAFASPAEQFEWNGLFWRAKEVRDFVEAVTNRRNSTYCVVDESLSFRPGNGSIEALLNSGWYLEYLAGLPYPRGIVALKNRTSNVLDNLERRRQMGTLPRRLIGKGMTEVRRDVEAQQNLVEAITGFYLSEGVPVLELETSPHLRNRLHELGNFLARPNEFC